MALETDGVELGVCPELSQIRPQFDLRLFETLPSTNTQLWKLLKAEAQTKARAGTVVIAQRQTAGRGQRDRIWQSDSGGLYLSLALEPDWPSAYSAQLTCFSAWGIVTALGNLGIPIQIKWPNDLFYKGKKLGGILTETKLSQSISRSSTPLSTNELPIVNTRIKQAVIGVGLNWHNQVPQNGTTLTKILESGPYGRAKTKISCLEILIAVVLRGILQGYFYQQQVGSQVFMKTYEKLLTQVGKTVSVEKGTIVSTSNSDTEHLSTPLASRCLESKCSGKVVGISEEGYLEVAVQQSARNTLLVRPSEIHI